MNFHSREWILAEMEEHYKESLPYFSDSTIVGLFYQGSGNYGVDTPASDVDTKMIVVPSFKDIALNRKAVSTTHVRPNNAHTDWKDIRLMLQTFRKQNLNFLEILFTEYTRINVLYADQWDRLVQEREAIARYSPYAAIKSMKGIAMEKYHAMEHEYPAKRDVLAKWGYDPKQLHHLLRVEEYIYRYINGESYAKCLLTRQPAHLIAVKNYDKPLYTLEDARQVAEISKQHVEDMCQKYLEGRDSKDVDTHVDELLDDVQYQIMKKAMEVELSES